MYLQWLIFKNPSWLNMFWLPQLFGQFCCHTQSPPEASQNDHQTSHAPLYQYVTCNNEISDSDISVLSLSYHDAAKGTMSDKSDLKAELERKKQRLAQIREEKKRKEEERKKKEVSKKVSTFDHLSHTISTLLCAVCVFDCFLSGRACVSIVNV